MGVFSLLEFCTCKIPFISFTALLLLEGDREKVLYFELLIA